MKITVELSDSDVAEICRATGVKKKGPALRKFLIETLQLRQRERIIQKFVTGEWSAELNGFESGQAEDRNDALEAERRWRE